MLGGVGGGQHRGVTFFNSAGHSSAREHLLGQRSVGNGARRVSKSPTFFLFILVFILLTLAQLSLLGREGNSSATVGRFGSMLRSIRPSGRPMA